MVRQQGTSRDSRPSAPETFSYVRQTETETTITRTTTITTVFPTHPNGYANTHPSGTEGSTDPLYRQNPNVHSSLSESHSGMSSTVLFPLPNTRIRKATSYTTLSLAHASIGTGATPVVPTTINPSCLNIQSSDSGSIVPERFLSGPATRFSHDSLKTSAISSVRRTRQRGLSLFGTRQKQEQLVSREAIDSLIPGEGHKDMEALSQKTKSNETLLKRPLLWKLRISPSMTSSQRTQNSELLSPKPPIGVENLKVRRNTKRPSTAPSNELMPKSGWSSPSLDPNRSPSMHPHSRNDGQHLNFAARSSSTIPVGTVRQPFPSIMSRDPISHSSATPRHVRRRSHTIAENFSLTPSVDTGKDVNGNSLHCVTQSDSIGNAEEIKRRFKQPSSSRSLSGHMGLIDRLPIIEQGSFEDRLHDSESGICLKQLLSSVSKAEALNILASSSSEIQSMALQDYMDQYDFTNEPIDIALRIMLAETGLPKETQQIDRALEAFAKRYCLCNQGLFANDDHAYILAFSLIMLHTDAFNKSNKNKMSKADYIKNTRLPSISSEFLEYLYDNILFAPFLLLDSATDNDGIGRTDPQILWTSRSRSHDSYVADFLESSLPSMSSRDRYGHLVNRSFSPSYVTVDEVIPPFDPYLYQGTLDNWNDESLKMAFAQAPYIEVNEKVSSSEVPIPMHGLTTGGVGGVFVRSPSGVSESALEALPSTEVWTLKVTKVGRLLRKDDLLEGGKRSTYRKWKEWTVILTSSQLLFFRDTDLARTLLIQPTSEIDPILRSKQALLRPEEIISLKDCIAVYDMAYTKYGNSLRFVMPNGRHILFRAHEEYIINEWIHLINYASTFRTAGIKMISDANSNNSNGQHRAASSSQILVGDGSPSTLEMSTSPFPKAFVSDESDTAIPQRSRRFVLLTKLRSLEGKMLAVDSELASDMRVCRQFTLALPFQRTTRDKMQAAVPSLAKKVQSLRLELAKLRCYQQILNQDLARLVQNGVERPRRTSSLSYHPSEESQLKNLPEDLLSYSSSLPPPSIETDLTASLSSVDHSSSAMSSKHHPANSIYSLSSLLSANKVAGWEPLLYPQQFLSEAIKTPTDPTSPHD